MALLVIQRQLLRQALQAIHNPPAANATVKVSKHNQPEKAKMVKELVPFLKYLYKKYLDAKITESKGGFVTLSLSEDINIPINIGDTVLGGKFKNKRIVVKSIGKNEKGDITINDKPFLKYRLVDEGKKNPKYQEMDPTLAAPQGYQSPIDVQDELEEANAVSGGKIHKFITGNNLTLQGKKHNQIEFEVLGTDNKSQLVKLRILSPKNLAGQELNVPFKTIRRGPFIKTDTKGQFEMTEDLRKWFGKGKTGSSDGGGWDRYGTDGQKLGKCGDGEDGDAYAACLSKEKAAKLGPDGRAAFVRRKRADQKKAGDAKKGGEQKKGQKPTFSKTGASEGVVNEIPMADLKQIDQFADKQLNPVDVVLTDKHFFDRLNDPRNGKEISNAELIGFFKRLAKHKKEFLEFLDKYKEVVATDDRTNINIPFMKQANKAIAKTIMRKNDFKTSGEKLEF